MRANVLRSSIWTFAIAICALPLLADGPQTSTIDGTITDAQGDGLPGVTVTLTGPQNTRTEITDANGDYRFALLQSGNYTVTADLEGLGSAERAVVLELGKREDVDLTLGATEEEITVTSEAALITKYDTGAVSALGAEELQHVPQATRNYWSNMKLMAGVVSYKQEFDQAPGVNGGIGQENVLFIDGVDISHNRRGGEMTFYMPSTVVSENRMESAGFSAEYGRGVSGVMNTTIKTGTNEFHGDFLYIGQNPAWRSENWLEMERPDSMINSYETGLGGPLFRDKAWFYASLSEMNDNRLDLTRDGNTIDTNRTAEPLVGKVNTQPNDRHQLALTWIDSPSGRLNPPGSAGDIYSVTRNSWNNRIQTLTWSFALTNSAFLEAKAANRELQTARIGSPPAEILSGASPDTPDGNNFRYRDLADGRRYNAPVNRLGAGGNDFPRDQANASLTFFRGKHEFKAGIDVQDVTFATITSIGTEYRGRGYGRSLPGGYASPVNKRVFDCPVPCNTAFTSGIGADYVQDRITVGDHLTVSLGLRQDTQ
ncbi:MAG: carboxypeptidase regulatory-like domain-containing protein, partial [Chloroflexota bacterium]|nr:carboxypeptidase regulatory-like domain-containing protein [Chloroflexota bacterium]